MFRDQYNGLGKPKLAAIQRIVNAKYQRGAAFKRQHPFVEILFSGITESGETLDLSELVREPLPAAFHRLIYEGPASDGCDALSVVSGIAILHRFRGPHCFAMGAPTERYR